MKPALLICLLCSLTPLFAQKSVPPQGRARVNGPSVENLARRKAISPHELLAKMFDAVETHWFVKGYALAKEIEFRGDLDARLPLKAKGNNNDGDDSIEFDIRLDGVATPAGKHRVDIAGDLGDVKMIDNLKRSVVTSQNFKAFSDSPRRTRKRGGGLTNYRSYGLKHLNAMKDRIINSGIYRSVYVGSGLHNGRDVDVVRVYKPTPRNPAKRNKKRPMQLRKLWTFWHDGGYEIWIYKENRLPAVMFYTNTTDNVYANLSFDYNREWLPRRISLNNNSSGAVGNGSLLLNFDRERMLTGANLEFDGERGVSLNMDMTVLFNAETDDRDFRILPPFGFKKLNRDHLKLMLLTQVSGGLLKLKKHGVSFRNFKF